MKRSFRKPGWDYGQTASYLITICLRRKSPLLGRIVNGQVALNEAGVIVQSCIELIPHFHPYTTLDEFIIMPNHVHIILHFNQTEGSEGSGSYGPQKLNLSSVIRGLKCSVTSKLKTSYPDFAWQPTYDDQILFTKKYLTNARNYVINNPKKAQEKKKR